MEICMLRLFLLMVTYSTIIAEESNHIIDVKQVIRDTLDAIAAVPTVAPIQLSQGKLLSSPESQTLPQAQIQLSRFFHLPHDFMHRLAAQNGFIDYDPIITRKPKFNDFDELKKSIFTENVQFDVSGKTNVLVVTQVNELNHTALNDNRATQLYVKSSARDNQHTESHQISHGNEGMVSTSGPEEINQAFVTEARNLSKKQQIPGTSYIHTPVLNLKNVHEDSRTKSDDPYKSLKHIAENAQFQAAQQQLSTITLSPGRINFVPVEVIQPALLDELPATMLPITSVTSSSPLQTNFSLPYQKQYRLTQLDEYYTLQKALSILNNKLNEKREPTKDSQTMKVKKNTSTSDSKVKMSNGLKITPRRMELYSTVNKTGEKNINFTRREIEIPPTERIKEETLDEGITDFNVQDGMIQHVKESDRVRALRAKMLSDRKKFASKKRILSSMKKRVNKTSNSQEKRVKRIQPHCDSIRSFLNEFTPDTITSFALQNCKFIANYYPDLKCDKIIELIKKCHENLKK